MLFFMFLLCLLINLVPMHASSQKKPSAPVNIKHQSTMALTIQEAVEIALLNKPNLQAYKYAIEASKAKGMQVWAEYLPQVNMTTNLSQGLGQNSVNTTIELAGKQLVYTFAGPIEKYKRAKKETNIIDLESGLLKRDIQKEVEKAFLDCWKQQQQQQHILSLHKASTSTYQMQAHANKVQLLDKKDWLKSNANRAQELATIKNYYQEIELAQRKLEFFMGQPIDLTLIKLEKPTSSPTEKKHNVLTLALEWKENKKIKPLPLTSYYKYAMKNREELKIAGKRVDIAKDDIYIAQRSNLPRVDVVASTGYQSREGTATLLGPGIPRNMYNIGMQVSWPIFNGLLKDHEEKAAHATMVKSMLDKEHNMQTIKLEIEKAYYPLLQALTNLKAKKATLFYTRNNLTLKKQQFKIGEISKVDLDTAIAEWEKAEYEWLDLKVEAAKQERELAYVCGYPKELINS